MFQNLVFILIFPLIYIDYVLIKKYQKEILFILLPKISLLRLIFSSVFLTSLLAIFLYQTPLTSNLNIEFLYICLSFSFLFFITTFLTKNNFNKNIKYWWIIIIPIFILIFLRNKITLEIQSNLNDSIQICYGRFNTKEYKPMECTKNIPITKSSQYKKYTFNFPYKRINWIRVYLHSNSSDISIKSINIYNHFLNYKIVKDTLTQQIINPYFFDIISTNNKSLHLQSTNKDHSFEIKDIPSLSISTSFKINFVIFFSVISLAIIKLTNYLKIRRLNRHFSLDTKNSDISNPLFISIFIVIIAWFIYQTFYFGNNIKLGIFPDEQYHYDQTLLYSQDKTNFKSDLIKYQNDPISEFSPVYYMPLGKLLTWFNNTSFKLGDVFFLRYINIFLSLINLFVSYLMVREITKNKLIQLSVLIMQTNILMFVFISSAISYDNTINLLANLSILFLIKLIKNPSYKWFFIPIIILINFLGILTKKTFIPLSLIEIIVFFAFIKTIFKKKLLIILSFLILFFSFTKSFQSVSIISNRFIKNINSYQKKPELKSFKDFTVDYFKTTEERTFGILAHQNMFKNDLAFYHILIAISAIFMLINLKLIIKNKSLIIIFFISISYIIIQFFYNYTQAYLPSGQFSVALQGRYNFPVLTSFLIFLNYSLLSRFSLKTKIISIFLIYTFFIYNGFFWFTQNITPEWFF